MKKTLLIAIFTCLATLAFAQKGSISGVLVDSVNQKTTLNYATVSVYKANDTVLHTYRLSDDKGVFKIPGLETGIKYRLVVNAWMYNILRKEVMLTAETPNLNLGNLLLNEKHNNLNEVVILSERPPIMVRKDTIEFNAESFKTLPTAVVEDLLKKLPGVSIASDGSIQVNGKTVSKILVDGKEFFGGDQQIATKNLPANIIDKIQVNDDPEAKRRDPDLLAANTPQIINLKLKKAIKKGAFGKLYAGGGPKEMYEAGAIMNFFRDTTQVSVLAYGNNINKPGFSIGDVSRIGGFSRSGINSVMINTDGGFSLNNISFGGTSNGVQTSAGAGANFNTLTKNGIKINGKYFFGQSNTLAEQLINVEQNLGSNKLFTNNNLNQRNKAYNHNIGARLEWKIDTLTTLTIEPTVTLNLLRNRGLQLTQSKDGSGNLLNDGVNNTHLKGDNTEFNLNSYLWKDFKKRGRSLNTSINITKRQNLSDNFNTTVNNFYSPSASTTNLDQLRDNNIKNLNLYASSNYNEPISKKLNLNVSVNANYLDNENALVTFYKNPLNQAYDVEDATLSETVNQSGFKTNTRASLRWKISDSWGIQPGLVFNTIDLKNNFRNYPSFEQHYQFIAPSLMIKYKDLTITYSPSFREPDVKYIQPVANNTDPLFVQKGNANLLPAKSYQVNANLYKYDTKRSLNYNFNASGSVQENAVIMSRTISTSGVQTNTPINANGIWQFYAGANIGKDFKNGKNQYSVGVGFWSNYTRSLVMVDNIKSDYNNISFSPSFRGRINLNDKFELGETYYLSINKSTYKNNFYNNLNTLTHNSETELILRLPKKMVWESTYRIQHNNQTVGGYSNNIQIWNAALTFLFMKNDRAQLKFAVNDILNTNTRRYITINENFIRDMQTNNLGRHGLITLTYNIQNFGGKVGGKDTFFRF
ncbi:outer membrane beta-barrel protein [Pedobacter sp. KR3-3]|uniref:Outer membrane beta-barrel protein n=1 Tax=Pedobacter albus TaxID=3113905 RepID=A0ABU7IA24_9SPHI|nr:outer membrane beta-barrel protein [Pedobacter sp. KR3-3]MEE1946204.1 outer membrane beta-barrel protein [Pedobacter sp. KR3-3]